MVLLSFVCVMVVDFSALQQWYCYSFCSKGKCHLQNSMSMTGVPHLSYQILQTLSFISIVFIGLCCVCLPCLWAVFTSHSFNMICLHVFHHTSLPSFQLQCPASDPSDPILAKFSSHHPCRQFGYSSLLSLYLEQDSPGEVGCDRNPVQGHVFSSLTLPFGQKWPLSHHI